MDRVEIENQLLYEFRGLSVKKLEETLNFVWFLKYSTHFKPMKSNKKRPLGLWDGKAKYLLHEDFKITDEEFLQS
jgi:hypothetical protein